MEKRTGKYSDEQIAAQEAIVLSLRNYSTNSANAPIKPPTPTPKPIPKAEEKPALKVDEKTQILLDTIKQEMDAIDDKKNQLGNKMAEIPDHIKCPELVAEIKALRRQWIEKNDTFWYVKTHGELPEVKSEPEVKFNLPDDKFELNKMLLNTRSNLSKYKGRLRTAKTDIKKQHYQKNIVVAEHLISEIELKITLK